MIVAARVGRAAPEFALECVTAFEPAARSVSLSDYAGRWLMLFFYPRDFSFVCPTELTLFSARLADFQQRGCDMLGISVDSTQLHREWLTTPAAKGGLGPLQFPLASDPDGVAARAYGVWVEDKEVSTRGLFIIDPDRVLQYSVVHNLSVGRNPDEALRVLDALRTGGLCPASWTSADGTIDPEGALQPGRILGHYRIRKQLGAGAFGAVFAVWDLRLERMAALKVLKRNVFESRDAVLTEARAAAKLNHPHICTVYAVEEEDGLPVIAMEYLEGRPLAKAVVEGMQRDLAMKLARQIASALAAAHGQGVVHGDLKPANIMVTKDNAAKILDFGLSTWQGSSDSANALASRQPRQDAAASAAPSVGAADATVEQAGSVSRIAAGGSAETAAVRGTPAYMSPEQAGGLPATGASDVFSFGLLLFETLTGRRAVVEESPLKMILDRQIRDLAADLAPKVGEPFRTLLAAMLARDPAQRPDMNEVVQILMGDSS